MPHDDDLAPTYFLDHDSEPVRDFTRRAAGDVTSPRERAVRLFAAVCDGLRYDPYAVSRDPADYRANVIARKDRGFCIPKAILFAAAARACGIPTRLGFVDVKNHLSSEALRAGMGTDVFVWHAYVELEIEGRRVKAAPRSIRRCARTSTCPCSRSMECTTPYCRRRTARGRRCSPTCASTARSTTYPFDQIARAFRETYGEPS
ncbi:MAG: transglutaminase domain-containing protein [Sandaracinaceae bacterium]|nr:transglutaminase domain-containing protein [Sandaracinaceae bacterium]